MVDEKLDEEAIFTAARKMGSPHTRQAYLEEACGGDLAVRARVLALLQAHEDDKSWLESPAPGLDGTLDEPLTERPGTGIGPYTLREQIGEGGFGVVFMAEQSQPVRRKVALKVLKPGMDTRQVVARFEAERQVLAIMDHPNIAKVFDGGETATGRPYFVMELVKGVPITAFCDQNHLSLRERLELFLPVCQAVQHAHQKGIIHRDLKPSNVLVTMHDATPVVKVIDFGVAKALGQDLTEKTLCTGFAQMIGTPLYMSPEQAGQSGLDIDTRSDIYSLGVLLYELMTGTTPFDKERFKQAPYEEIRRIIREDEPPKPSTRISTLGQAATTVFADRKSDPRRLGQMCRGELDWIVMKCLEKDRSRRYETASALAADLAHYLHDEPVLACPPSAWYRFRKFARRNKTALLTASSVFVVLVTATVALAVAIALVSREEERTRDALTDAETQWTRAEEANRLTQEANLALKAKTIALEKAFLRQRQTSYYRDIALAEVEWVAGQIARAEQRLEQCPADLRGWEWHYLQRLCHAELLTVRPAEITSMAYSPDGKWLATGTESGSVHLWDGHTGQLIHTLVGHSGRVVSLAFRPDGQRLASVSDPSQPAKPLAEVKVWDLATWRPVLALGPLDGKVKQITYHPEGGKFLLVGNRVMSVRDGVTGEEMQILRDSATVNHATYSPDGRWIATGEIARVKIWDTGTGTVAKSFVYGIGLPAGFGLTSVSFRGDTERVACATTDKKVVSWQLDGKRFELTGAGVRAVYAPEGDVLATATDEGTIKLWHGDQEVLRLRGHSGIVSQLAFSADGKRLASAGKDGTIKIWDVGSKSQTGPLAAEGGVLAASHDGKFLACLIGPGMGSVWDSTAGRRIMQLPGLVSGMAFDRARRLAAVGAWGTVKVWDAATGMELRTLGQKSDGFNAVAFGPDGTLAGVGKKHAIHIWNAANADAVWILRGHVERVARLAFSPNGKTLASASWDQTVKLWDLTTGKEIRSFKSEAGKIYGLAFTPKGDHLAAACQNDVIKVFDLTTGASETLRGHSGAVRAVAFSPDGKRLASAGADKTVKIWDPATSQEVLTLRGHTDVVHSVTVSPDGQQIASVAAGLLGRPCEGKIWDGRRFKSAAPE